MGSSSPGRDEHLKKYLSCHHPVDHHFHHRAKFQQFFEKKKSPKTPQGLDDFRATGKHLTRQVSVVDVAFKKVEKKKREKRGKISPENWGGEANHKKERN